jgi:hypothetical protein
MIAVILLQMMGPKEETFRPRYFGVPGHLSDLSNGRIKSPSAPSFPESIRLAPILVSLNPILLQKRTGSPPVKTGKQRSDVTQCAMCIMRLFRKNTEAAQMIATRPDHFDSPS